MRHLQRRLDRLEGSGGGDEWFILPLPGKDVSGYPPERLIPVEIPNPNPNEPGMTTVPGLIVCRNSEVPQLLRSIEGRSRILPGTNAD